MAATPHPVSYAPAPRAGRRWLNRRVLSLVIVALAAAAAAYVVVPRVWQRGELLRAQRELLANRASLPPGAAVAETMWMGSLPGLMLSNARVPEIEAFTGWAIGTKWTRAAFAGGRRAGEGAPERIVLVQAAPAIFGESQPPEIVLHTYVFERGGWTKPPVLLNQTTDGPHPMPVPPPAGWRLAVLPGAADPADPARFVLHLEAGYAGTADTCRLTIVGRLMGDGTVRYDWPRQSTPVSTAP